MDDENFSKISGIWILKNPEYQLFNRTMIIARDENKIKVYFINSPKNKNSIESRGIIEGKLIFTHKNQFNIINAHVFENNMIIDFKGPLVGSFEIMDENHLQLNLINSSGMIITHDFEEFEKILD